MTNLKKEFVAPTSATSGLASYDLESGAKRAYPNPRIKLKPKKLTSLIALLVKADVDTAAYLAATSPLNLLPPPSKAQLKAGNYKKGHVRISGLDITIENPQYSGRSGGELQAHYGYIKGTIGADGDHVDCFVRAETPNDWQGTVFIIDQYLHGRFDEHKCMIGFPTENLAIQVYRNSYDLGWKVKIKVSQVSLDEFKQWLKGPTVEPFIKWDESEHPRDAAGRFIDALKSSTEENPLNPRERVFQWESKIQVSRGISPKQVYLDSIESFKPTGEGAGSRALKHLTSLADEHGVTLVGFSNPIKRSLSGLNQEQLNAWYTKNGFKLEPHGDGFMSRAPRTRLKLSGRMKVIDTGGSTKKFDYSEAGLSCPKCGNASLGKALLKPVKYSRIKEYVLSHDAPATKAISKVLKSQGALLANEIVKRVFPASKIDLRSLLKTTTDVYQILDDLSFDGFSVATREAIEEYLETSYKDGFTSALHLVNIAITEDNLNQLDPRALQFARERAAELVGMRYLNGEWIENPNPEWSITETTREALRNLVVKGVEQGWGPGTLKEAITDSHSFSEKRAESIARTELAHAHVNGNIAGWRASGVVIGKKWILADTHPQEDVCDNNQLEGEIPLEQDFSSGHDGPPAHPECLCDLVPIIKSQSKS